MTLPKYYICPMSRNIVDTIMDLDSNDFGLLPSRRQIDYDGGYVNKWNTESFYKYIKPKKSIIIERDHGGPKQGNIKDDGFESFKCDSRFMNIIHVDPWKHTNSLKKGIQETIKYLKFIHEHNRAIKFEIGTEESIRKFNEVELIELLDRYKTANKTFKNIKLKSLFTKIKEIGGINDSGGDLKAMGITNKTLPGLIRKTPVYGQSGLFGSMKKTNFTGADEVALVLWEEGYFPEFPRDRSGGQPSSNDLF